MVLTAWLRAPEGPRALASAHKGTRRRTEAWRGPGGGGGPAQVHGCRQAGSGEGQGPDPTRL